MKYPEFKNKKVTIWGLGVYGNGPAAIKFFSENGAKVTVTDLKPAEEFKDVLEELSDYTDIKYVFGKNSEEDILNCDLLFRAPAIPIEVPLLQEAIKKGVNVQMPEGFFLKYSLTKNVIGVTGTKGKSTTSTFVYQALKSLGKTAYLAGTPQNSSMSLLEIVKPSDWVVLEISSYDCEGLAFNEVSPHIAAVTNISEDHLFRYKSYEAYAMSKTSIFKYQTKGDHLLLGDDNEFLNKYLEVVPDGVDLSIVKANGNATGIEPNSMGVRGLHNGINANIAFNILCASGFDENKAKKALEDLKPPRYRLEEIGDINGVRFINDTTATVPVATIMAILELSQDRPVFILGGSDKTIDYKGLVDKVLSSGIEYVMLEGTATDKYVEFGLDKDLIYDDFERAIRDAYAKAKKNNGLVVLSPGTHSFGMFKNEYDRGDQFNAIFEKIKNEN